MQHIEILHNYIKEISDIYSAGNATEHSYRPALKKFIESLNDKIVATNEPKRIECGAPDYIITIKGTEIPIGYIEAKDVGRLHALTPYEQNQKERYLEGIGQNLIYTDYLEFIFYKDGIEVARVNIADNLMGIRLSDIKELERFINLITDFLSYKGTTIKSSEKLAQMMAGKAKIMADAIHNSLQGDEEKSENSTIQDQYKGFKKILIHDISIPEFADIYAQTIAYGMFVARLHDKSQDNFSRQEALDLIPKSNPFLRKLFMYVAGPDIDVRIKWTVEALANIFSYTDIEKLMSNYGKSTKQNDATIHFYETFLSEYNPSQRKARGVWYTPQPVVDFIVKSVDDVLKSEFGLNGLADTSKTTITYNDPGTAKPVKKDVHRVQILDPATGTGTFLAQVIRKIHENFATQKGIWTQYVKEHIFPRINGFELLMASYSMAHLKLDLLLKELGYDTEVENKRLQIYLINSLEEFHEDTGTLFETWLANESREANFIKRDVPVMVVLGNPPYSGVSSNNGEWITNLIDIYKQEPSGGKLQERKHWLNDDYVKFIRLAQYYIDKNKSGISSYINNHSFLDNPTFRGMRYSLLQSYDKIYILNLHGNSLKKETTEDGGKDENVFDIQAGVSINIFVKTGENKKLADVYYYDLYGKRDLKYDFLYNHDITNTKWKKLKPTEPYYFFTDKNFANKDEYDKGFKIDDLFPVNSTGIVTMGDGFVIAKDKSTLKNNMDYFLNNNLKAESLKSKYDLGKNYGDWITSNKSKISFDENKIINFSYRPFDTRYTYFDINLIWRPREKVMKNFLTGENYGLAISKQVKSGDNFYHAFVCGKIFESCYVSNKTGEITYGFPLYIYDDETSPNPTLLKD